jgi:hypothetical protein
MAATCAHLTIAATYGDSSCDCHFHEERSEAEKSVRDEASKKQIPRANNRRCGMTIDLAGWGHSIVQSAMASRAGGSSLR